MPHLLRLSRVGFLRLLLALTLAVALWFPFAHLLFQRDLAEYRATSGLSPMAKQLAAAQLGYWENDAHRAAAFGEMRAVNPEWDFMSRTYLVLALANMALRDPTFEARACTIMDRVIEDTLAIERSDGFKDFLLSYGHGDNWVMQPPRSVFVDGEIALMMAARRLIEEKPEYREPLQERVAVMVERMEASPVLSAESYPDECWLFCNSIALASIRLADVLDGTDHSEFLGRWLATAKRELLDEQTGILISAWELGGTPNASGFAPEGSSIWMAAHMLEVIDGEFARDQYRRARTELRDSLLGFGYAREWPVGQEGFMDIDSGPVIPGLGASASSSGLAILGAAAFGDDEWLTELLTALEFAGFPEDNENGRRYLASNPVGDAVLLYALTEGPLWENVEGRTAR